MAHPQQQQQPIYNQNQHFYQQQHAPAALRPQYPVLPQHPVLPQQQPAHLVNPPTHQRDGLHQAPPPPPANIVVSPKAGTSTELSPGIQTLQQPIESKLTPKKKRTPNKKPTPASEAVSAVKDYVARLMA